MVHQVLSLFGHFTKLASFWTSLASQFPVFGGSLLGFEVPKGVSPFGLFSWFSPFSGGVPSKSPDLEGEWFWCCQIAVAIWEIELDW